MERLHFPSHVVSLGRIVWVFILVFSLSLSFRCLTSTTAHCTEPPKSCTTFRGFRTFSHLKKEHFGQPQNGWSLILRSSLFFFFFAFFFACFCVCVFFFSRLFNLVSSPKTSPSFAGAVSTFGSRGRSWWWCFTRASTCTLWPSTCGWRVCSFPSPPLCPPTTRCKNMHDADLMRRHRVSFVWLCVCLRAVSVGFCWFLLVLVDLGWSRLTLCRSQ